MTTKPTPLFFSIREKLKQDPSARIGSMTLSLTLPERDAIARTSRRVIRAAADSAPSFEEARATLRRTALRVAKTRRTTRALLLSRFKWIEVVSHVQSVVPSSVLNLPEDDRTQRIARAVKRWERAQLEAQAKAQNPPLHERLPLYACSGELEATGIDTWKKTARWHKEHFDCGRDGGGQHEIRFRIAGVLPAVACRLVTQLGGPSRNGGHIHLNCQQDEQTGERVFHALRLHLAWVRWMCPRSRRMHRYASVRDVPATFADARRRKFAALSANTWSRTGTVEMRLWATSKNPKDWQFRADLMRAIARWSETLEGQAFRDRGALPIRRETGAEAFAAFVRWSALYDRQTLKKTLSLLKRRAAQRTDENARREVGALLDWFEASQIVVSGYTPRRRS